jgi:DNA invertase Pin-like site-specific DNA recombinase
LLQLVEEFHNKKVKFICFSPSIDTETAQGRFFLQIMGAVAELEREMIRDRIKDNLNRKKRDIEKNGYFRTREGKKREKLGRPTGSKDKGRRKRGGYFLRYQKTTLAKVV